jgi:hypothetical protein
MVKTPQALEFKVTRVRPVETAGDGRSFLECTTSVGVVAFWGDDDSMINIEGIEGKRVPFRVRARCVQPDPPFAQRHSLWVGPTTLIEFL